MGLSAERLTADLAALAELEPAFAAAIAAAGEPDPRIRQPGYATLLRTIVGQQVSVAAAAAVWGRLEALLGPGCPPAALIDQPFDALRACGLSRQKQGYARSLGALVLAGDIDFSALPAEDEAAIALLTRIKGIGRWSAEIYLLFAEGRGDIWPAGDLAVQEGVARILRLPARPDEKATRALAEPWRPYRGAAAIFTWHYYMAKATI
jgi:DNA-3-methyladenine glycosylase II